MRGKVSFGDNSDLTDGITPAYAGKRALPCSRARLWRDHPRVCGEKPGDYIGYRLAAGSPPRMRGKVEELLKRKYKERITPAYAGKSCVALLSACLHKDHPRVCGEKCSSNDFVKELSGSPPRMRGKD